MSERGKRVFRFLLDPERDADVIGRIEAQPSMTGYVRELVRRDKHERDKHDERLDFAALKASELQAENDKLRELVRDMYAAFVHGNCYRWCEFKEPCNYIDDGKCQWFDRMAELGIEVE